MPCGKRIDKVIPTSYEDRLKLSTLFVEYLQSEVNIPIKLITNELDDVEGKRYTHEAIEELKSKSQDEIFQLVGIDGYLSIKERIIGPDEKFVINKRSGYEVPEELFSKPNLVFIDEVVSGISSTLIREIVKDSNSEYKKLVPNKIADYIEEKGLYL